MPRERAIGTSSMCKARYAHTGRLRSSRLKGRCTFIFGHVLNFVSWLKLLFMRSTRVYRWLRLRIIQKPFLHIREKSGGCGVVILSIRKKKRILSKNKNRKERRE